MNENRRPKLVGINHIALEVGDIDKRLILWTHFDITLRGRGKNAAFIDMGDQFIALIEGRRQPADDERHFGLVVNDRSAVRDLAREAGAKVLDGDFLDFLDPWGNRVRFGRSANGRSTVPAVSRYRWSTPTAGL